MRRLIIETWNPSGTRSPKPGYQHCTANIRRTRAKALAATMLYKMAQIFRVEVKKHKTARRLIAFLRGMVNAALLLAVFALLPLVVLAALLFWLLDSIHEKRSSK